MVKNPVPAIAVKNLMVTWLQYVGMAADKHPNVTNKLRAMKNVGRRPILQNTKAQAIEITVKSLLQITVRSHQLPNYTIIAYTCI